MVSQAKNTSEVDWVQSHKLVKLHMLSSPFIIHVQGTLAAPMLSLAYTLKGAPNNISHAVFRGRVQSSGVNDALICYLVCLGAIKDLTASILSQQDAPDSEVRMDNGNPPIGHELHGAQHGTQRQQQVRPHARGHLGGGGELSHGH